MQDDPSSPVAWGARKGGEGRGAGNGPGRPSSRCTPTPAPGEAGFGGSRFPSACAVRAPGVASGRRARRWGGPARAALPVPTSARRQLRLLPLDGARGFPTTRESAPGRAHKAPRAGGDAACRRGRARPTPRGRITRPGARAGSSRWASARWPRPPTLRPSAHSRSVLGPGRAPGIGAARLGLRLRGPWGRGRARWEPGRRHKPPDRARPLLLDWPPRSPRARPLLCGEAGRCGVGCVFEPFRRNCGSVRGLINFVGARVSNNTGQTFLLSPMRVEPG